MTRKEKILCHIDKNGMGIEIGPFDNPVAPKREGYQVHIIDHVDKQTLIGKYEDHKVNPDNIEEVDFIWNGESYSKLTGKTKSYDWIIASHVIEHTPDLIGFLHECDSVLKDNGVLSLVVPDKRLCFDHFRPLTGLAKIIDNHMEKRTIHSPGTVAEHRMNVVNCGGIISWAPGHKGKYRLIHTLAFALERMEDAKQGKYIDSHAWCFTPSSFRLLIHDLNSLGLVSLQEVSFFPTEGNEFFITLGHKGEKIEFDRLAMLKTIESELSENLTRKRIRDLPRRIKNRAIRDLRRIKNRAVRRLFG
jgi:SAM-dependent methyltransferase